jgi:DNA-binding response OmpR family regulator
MTETKRIAIAEDDQVMAEFVAQVATEAGHRVVRFSTGDALMRQLTRDTFDLLLLDWNMPGASGLDVLRWVRANMDAPPAVIMLSSRAEKVDITECLSAGADNYIIKPEAASVIAARINAVLRRTSPTTLAQRHEQFGIYIFDRLEGSVARHGESVALTAKEFALALMFFQNKNRPIARSYILETIWNSVGDLPTRTLDMHVSRIRSKLELSPENGFRISTIFGYGYRLESYDGEPTE